MAGALPLLPWQLGHAVEQQMHISSKHSLVMQRQPHLLLLAYLHIQKAHQICKTYIQNMCRFKRRALQPGSLGLDQAVKIVVKISDLLALELFLEMICSPLESP